MTTPPKTTHAHAGRRAAARDLGRRLSLRRRRVDAPLARDDEVVAARVEADEVEHGRRARRRARRRATRARRRARPPRRSREARRTARAPRASGTAPRAPRPARASRPSAARRAAARRRASSARRRARSSARAARRAPRAARRPRPCSRCRRARRRAAPACSRAISSPKPRLDARITSSRSASNGITCGRLDERSRRRAGRRARCGRARMRRRAST